MAKMLIDTPFPTTLEVAAMLGVPASRVREVEQMLLRSKASSTAARKASRKAKPAKASRPKPSAPVQ
jgi:hypothetical protein